MQHPEEIAQAIRDRQVRYRHEAYRGRFRSHPVRRWVGTGLVQIGETIRGHASDGMESTTTDPPARFAA